MPPLGCVGVIGSDVAKERGVSVGSSVAVGRGVFVAVGSSVGTGVHVGGSETPKVGVGDGKLIATGRVGGGKGFSPD